MFESRRRRGVAIGLVATGIVISYVVIDVRAANLVEKRSTRLEVVLRDRLPAIDPLVLLAAGDPTTLLGEEFRYATIARDVRGELTVRTEVSWAWRTRCVVATRSVTAQVAVETRDGHCE